MERLIGVADLVADSVYHLDIGFRPSTVQFVNPLTEAVIAEVTSASADGGVVYPASNAGQKQVQTLVFDADLIADNEIDGEVGGTAITTVTYATSNVATLAAVASGIEGIDGVETAVSDGVNTITVTTELDLTDKDLTGFVVTAGLSQAGVVAAETAPSIVSNERLLTYQPGDRIASYTFTGQGDEVLQDPSIDDADYVNLKPALDYMRNAAGATNWKDRIVTARGIAISTTAAFTPGKVKVIATK